MTRLFKIMTREEWLRMQATGHSDGSPDDRRDGYIHLSAAHQLHRTAAKHFAGRHDLILVAVEEDHLDGLRWEVSRGGGMFPHVYGVLPMAAVAWARPLPWVDGAHVFPDDVES